MTGHVLWRRANWNAGVVHEEANLGPLADGIQVHAAIDERRGELAAAALQRVSTQRHGSLRLVRLQELHGLRDGEGVQEVLDQERVVAVVRREVGDEPLDVLPAAAPGFAPGFEVLEHPNDLLDPGLDVLQIRRRVRVVLVAGELVHVLVLDVEHLLCGGILCLALPARVFLPRLLLDGEERLLIGLRLRPGLVAGEILLQGAVVVLVGVVPELRKLVLLVLLVLVAEEVLRVLRRLVLDALEGLIVILVIIIVVVVVVVVVVIFIFIGILLGVVTLHLHVEGLVPGQILLPVRVVPECRELVLGIRIGLGLLLVLLLEATELVAARRGLALLRGGGRGRGSLLLRGLFAFRVGGGGGGHPSGGSPLGRRWSGRGGRSALSLCRHGCPRLRREATNARGSVLAQTAPLSAALRDGAHFFQLERRSNNPRDPIK